jgi:hypothetical protein
MQVKSEEFNRPVNAEKLEENTKISAGKKVTYLSESNCNSIVEFIRQTTDRKKESFPATKTSLVAENIVREQ